MLAGGEMVDRAMDWQHVIKLQVFPGVVRSRFVVAFLLVEGWD